MAGISLVQANLASFPVESALYGLFLLLSIISLLSSLQYARHAVVPANHYKYNKLRIFDPALRALKRPIFVGGVAIVLTVSGVCTSLSLGQSQPGNLTYFVALALRGH